MKIYFKMIILASVSAFAFSGCVSMPAGPGVQAYPGSGKSFDEFQMDDAACQAWAGRRVGITSDEIQSQSTLSGAGTGAVLGAGIGALIGSASGNPGAGAAIGAGSGLLLGAAAGADEGRYYSYEAQRRYDNYYLQCMYGKGHQVPGNRGVRYRSNRYYAPPPPPPGYYPQRPYSAPPPPPPHTVYE